MYSVFNVHALPDNCLILSYFDLELTRITLKVTKRFHSVEKQQLQKRDINGMLNVWIWNCVVVSIQQKLWSECFPLRKPDDGCSSYVGDRRVLQSTVAGGYSQCRRIIDTASAAASDWHENVSDEWVIARYDRFKASVTAGRDVIVIMAAEVQVLKARHRRLRHDDMAQSRTPRLRGWRARLPADGGIAIATVIATGGRWSPRNWSRRPRPAQQSTQAVTAWRPGTGISYRARRHGNWLLTFV